MTHLPDEARTRLREIGRRFEPATIQEVRELLAPLHHARGASAGVVARDLAYGPDERQRLDVHAATGAAGAPVLLFVHGGGFVAGDKSDPVFPYYDHLGRWAADHGYVAVCMTYRLAPAHQWPSAAEDVAAAVAWVGEHIAEHGGDPDRIVVMGQSAGGAHAASYLAGHGGPVAASVVGGVVLSGIYDPVTADKDERLLAYYGADPEQYAARSALPGLVASELPMLFGVAEWDMSDFHRQAVVLLDAMARARGVIPPFVTVQEHGHLSEILAIGLDDDAFDGQLARFLRRVATEGAARV